MGGCKKSLSRRIRTEPSGNLVRRLSSRGLRAHSTNWSQVGKMDRMKTAFQTMSHINDPDIPDPPDMDGTGMSEKDIRPLDPSEPVRQYIQYKHDKASSPTSPKSEWNKKYPSEYDNPFENTRTGKQVWILGSNDISRRRSRLVAGLLCCSDGWHGSGVLFRRFRYPRPGADMLLFPTTVALTVRRHQRRKPCSISPAYQRACVFSSSLWPLSIRSCRNPTPSSLSNLMIPLYPSLPPLPLLCLLRLGILLLSRSSSSIVQDDQWPQEPHMHPR